MLKISISFSQNLTFLRNSGLKLATFGSSAGLFVSFKLLKSMFVSFKLLKSMGYIANSSSILSNSSNWRSNSSLGS